MKEKKRRLRLLMEDVTLTKGDALHADIPFAGGATRSLDVPNWKLAIARSIKPPEARSESTPSATHQ
jgi:hypothetical protein